VACGQSAVLPPLPTGGGGSNGARMGSIWLGSVGVRENYQIFFLNLSFCFSALYCHF
jgi:hypothetical protein